MLGTWQDLLMLYYVMFCISLTVNFISTLLLYLYIRDRLDQLINRKHDVEISNLPAEVVAAPPMAEPVAQPQTTPYSIYVRAHVVLYKLIVNGEDNTDYANYLRNVMEECWAKLDTTQRESAELDCAEAWRHV